MAKAVHDGAFFSAASPMSSNPCLVNSLAMQSVLLWIKCGDSLLLRRLAHSGTPVLLAMVMLCSTCRDDRDRQAKGEREGQRNAS